MKIEKSDLPNLDKRWCSDGEPVHVAIWGEHESIIVRDIGFYLQASTVPTASLHRSEEEWEKWSRFEAWPPGELVGYFNHPQDFGVGVVIETSAVVQYVDLLVGDKTISIEKNRLFKLKER